MVVSELAALSGTRASGERGRREMLRGARGREMSRMERWGRGRAAEGKGVGGF